MAKTRLRPDDGSFTGPEFILIDDRWALAERLSVADWRKARDFSMRGDTKHLLAQFRLATVLLEDAQRYGLREEACLMKALADAGSPPTEVADKRESFKVIAGDKDGPSAA